MAESVRHADDLRRSLMSQRMSQGISLAHGISQPMQMAGMDYR
ncbi:hypothetical protein PSYPI_36864 [Pseudomonas syringae pv. pisi str. 1704B]|uniref:Uncharacterized protein n=1 Tax=Pseudomonas syringae pv. pisi str. 1704B TaxID=629263 RepID=F3GKE4_PSESJ|nr:hypothetical protein PSYPI_36864 [Pseudomonas syringae pv. pisi str. 1704B]